MTGGELLLFGGWDPETAGTGGQILDDVWALDLATRTWTECAPMPRGPSSRHVAVNVNGRVVVHTFRCLDSVLVWGTETRAACKSSRRQARRPRPVACMPVRR